MLSNASRVFQTSDKLKENFTCGICGENYTNDKFAPITLHCGHTFCRNCIDQLGKDKHVPCGVCFTNTWTPAKKLTKNYQML
uniref:RING-type domain-containing protein n=1 Tax=Acrobeloides nanus TaxID=290746 RepID=A0A914DLL8_9BILA